MTLVQMAPFVLQPSSQTLHAELAFSSVSAWDLLIATSPATAFSHSIPWAVRD